MKSPFFISKNYDEVVELAAFLAKRDIPLISQSFLHFEPVQFSIQHAFDVIYFSSPRSVIFFQYQQKIPQDVLIACTGNKTAELLKGLGYAVHFEGEESGTISTVAEHFKAWCGDKRVLFPSSSISKNSISSRLEETQKEVITVYTTNIVSKPLSYCGTYAFTSPSNAEGFLALNTIPTDALVYSWGESTTAYLTSKGIQVTATLKNASVEDLIQLLDKQ